MLYEEQNTFRRTPGLVTWSIWVVLTTFGGIVGTLLLSFVSNANPSLNGLLIWLYLASPLFFVALGQWLLVRRFVAQSGWWLLTGALGFIFVYPCLLIYDFSALLTNGQSLIFGTQEFWSVSLCYMKRTHQYMEVRSLLFLVHPQMPHPRRDFGLTPGPQAV